MTIRKAVKEDAAFIAPYLLLAMKNSIYKKIGDKDYKEAEELLLHFVKRENNQYSYENCLVAEDEGQVQGAVNIYDGARVKELREPVLEYIEKHFNEYLEPEEETQAGEFYIDSVGVNPDYRGKGAGTKMLQYLIEDYVEKKNQTLGLLVGEDNTVARRLYSKMGFKPVGKKVLRGKEMMHLQIAAR